jgi:hypothetical protein
VHAEVNVPNESLAQIAVGDTVYFAAIEQRVFQPLHVEQPI